MSADDADRKGGAADCHDPQRLPWSAKLALLREQLVNPLRQPGAVLLCAAELLARHASRLSDAEGCAVTEQALIAALDCGQLQQATDYHRVLVKRFGRHSVRVRKLQGMILEAQGNESAALQLYDGLLKDSPADPFVAKRYAAMLRGAGEYRRAIDALEKQKLYADPKEPDHVFSFLQLYPTDSAALRELVALHWLVWDVPRALYYAEEVVMVDPFAFAAHCRLGEILVVANDLERAATSYAQSLRLNSAANNVRAMYGLWHCACRLLQARAPDVGRGDGIASAAPSQAAGLSAFQRGAAPNAASLVEWAEQHLRVAYHDSPMLSAVDMMITARH